MTCIHRFQSQWRRFPVSWFAPVQGVMREGNFNTFFFKSTFDPEPQLTAYPPLLALTSFDPHPEQNRRISEIANAVYVEIVKHT
jgi:hypothetical protein